MADANSNAAASATKSKNSNPAKRQRKQTERFGNTAHNKDYHFESTSPHHSDSDADIEPRKIVGNSFNVNERMINGLNESKQASRIEAKIHEVLKCVQQMRISLISSMAASAVAPIEKISELPVATPSALDHLESGLNTPTHRKKIFDYLVTINGIAGSKKGSKVFRSVVLATISPQVLSKYTWTGRSAKPNAKLSFEGKHNIIQMLFDVVFAYDSTYTRTECEDDWKYKIFKYAYKEEDRRVQVDPVATESNSTTVLPVQQSHSGQQSDPNGSQNVNLISQEKSLHSYANEPNASYSYGPPPQGRPQHSNQYEPNFYAHPYYAGYSNSQTGSSQYTNL